MKSVTKITIIFLSLLIYYPVASACTDITLKAKDGTILVARTMEFGPNLHSAVVSSPRAKFFQTKFINGQKGLSWTSKYGYVFADYFGSNQPVDGLNEKGLSFGYLYLPGYTQYQTVSKETRDRALSYFDVPDWILGNFSSVAEVKKALPNVVVFAEPHSFPGIRNFVFPLHAIVTDAKGKSIVIEFVKGKMRVYDNKVGVLTNSPTFDWQLTNLKNYVNLTPYSAKPIKVNGQTYSVTGLGSGMLGLPGDSTPPSRFVRMALITASVLPVKHTKSLLALAQHIINNVDIPRGMVRGKRGQRGQRTPLETTQWTVFKDLKHHILYFKSYNNSTLQSVEMSKVDFAPDAKQIRIPMSRSQIIIDALK